MMSLTNEHDRSLFINRELSWLAFNGRVLEEAADPSTPLLERVKFAAIAASNLDEFFMVRVARLHRRSTKATRRPISTGLTPTQQLAAIGDGRIAFVAALYRLVHDELFTALAAHRYPPGRVRGRSRTTRLDCLGTSFASRCCRC